MPTNLVINGTTYAYPATGDSQWGTAATNWAIAVTNGMLQKQGGLFTLTAEADFGINFGLKSLYFKSRSSNTAVAGILRLANADVISFRNSGNTADLALAVGSTDVVPSYAGVDIVTISATQTLTNKTFTSPTITGNLNVTGTITASNFSGTSSGTNTGDISLGTANGLSLAAGQILSLGLSSTSTTGSLSSTDWNTFNGKQASGSYITSLNTDIVATGPGAATATIQANVVSNSKLAQMATLTIKGNNTGGTANALDLSVAQVKTMLSLAGTNSGDVTLSGENYLSLTGQAITVSPITLSGSNVTGTLPISHGGTTATTANAAFNNLSPMTTNGDMIYRASGIAARLAIGTDGFILSSVSGVPTWVTPSSAVVFPLLAPDGSTGAPSYSFINDATSGLFLAAAASVSLAISGSLAANFSVGATSFVGDVSATGNIQIQNQKKLELFDTGSAHHVDILAASTSANYVITLPAAAPATNTFLEFDGTNYVWASPTIGFPLFAADGTLGAPSYSFTNEHGLGLYRPSAGQLSVAVAGGVPATFNTSFITFNAQLRPIPANVGAPSYSFSSDVTSGMYSSAVGQVNISAAGTKAISFTVGAVTANLPISIPDGALSAPGINFTTESNTGIYRPSALTLGVVVNGALPISVGTSTVTFNAELLAATGNVSAPHYSFSAETDKGVYSGGSGIVSIGANGVNRLNVSAVSTESKIPFYGVNGTLSVPAYSFSSEASLGFYRPSASQIGVAVNGALPAVFNDTFITINGQLRPGIANASAPPYAFTAETDTGMYSAGPGIINFSNGGVLGATLNASHNFIVVGTIAASNFSGTSSGTNTGDVTIGTANGLSLAGQVLSLSAIPNAATTAVSTNTASAIVARDGSGNFAAGTITASLTGHASLDLALTGGALTGAVSLTGSADAVQLLVKGNATQTSDVLQIQTSASANLFKITNAGNATLAGQMAVNGSIDTTSLLRVGGGTNPLTTAQQNGITSQFTATSSATSYAIGFFSAVTNAASVSLNQRVGYYHANQTKGAGSSIAIDVAYYTEIPTQGTGNVCIADNFNAASNFFIHSTQTNPSLISGDFKINTAGKGLQIKEGSNAKMGTATLSAGTVVVSTTAVTASSRIFITVQSLGTVAVATPVAVTARTAGTSFTISSSSITDTSVIAWMLVEPA